MRRKMFFPRAETAFKTLDYCYDPKLITRPKTSHILIISAISSTQAIITDHGKISAKNFSEIRKGAEPRP